MAVSRLETYRGLTINHSRFAFTVGHSLAITLYTQVSRSVPFAAIILFRSTPSSFAPSRSMALRLC